MYIVKWNIWKGWEIEMEHIKRIKRELVYEGVILNFYKDYMETSSGKVVIWDFLSHKTGAAAVVPVTNEGKIIMVRQYRNALEREMLEIPAGARDTVEEPTLECATRELEEETGFASRNLEYLMTLRTAIAYCDELVDIYVATDLESSCQHLDEEESIEVEEYELDELCQMIYRGEIQDAKTIAALMAYKAKYNK